MPEGTWLSTPQAGLSVPCQVLEGLLTSKASSWVWIFLPVSNLEDRQAQVSHCFPGAHLLRVQGSGALVTPPAHWELTWHLPAIMDQEDTMSGV